MEIECKRVYLPAGAADGFRILVDRLWPRGLKKDRAAIDLWARAVAPSDGLRQWFAHVPERFPEFAERYASELRESKAWADMVAEARRHERVTLLFAARDEQHNNAVVVARLLREATG